MRAALLGALLAASLLGACASRYAPVGPWPYEFELGKFEDRRPQDDALMKASTPFTVDSFMRGWRNSVERSVFANQPAKLDIILKEYEITSAGSSYAMNMDVRLTGRDQYGRTLGAMNAKCNAVVRITERSWWDFGQQARGQGTTYPLTAAARNATMWQKVMDSCVAELAKQFDTTLAAGSR